MLRVLRELESNTFAMLIALFVFILTLFLIAIIADAILHIVDWGTVLGLGGMGTGNTLGSSASQMMSNRSANYTPLVANPNATPLPVKSHDPGDLT